jgi:hypothetical protein
MSTRLIVPVGLVIMLAVYGMLKAVVLVILAFAGIFFGTMFFFALYDAIRTRNDPPGQRTRPHGRKLVDDADLAELRKMAGLET